MVSNPSDRKSLLTMSLVLSIVILGTVLVSYIARGYRLDFQNGPGLKSTGLLSATSRPKAASVFINGILTTATDDTINLTPGDYQIKIAKDGYLPWSKKIHIKQETVFQSDAQLFRSVPDLKPITLTGAINPNGNLDNNKIVFAVASASASRDNGLYIVDTFDSPLNLNRSSSHQIAPNFTGVDWTKFEFTISPNSKEILATSETQNVTYLLPLTNAISQKDLFDVTPRLPQIKQDWDAQTKIIIADLLAKVPAELKTIVSTDSATNIQFSSDDTKILYLANQNGVIKKDLISPPPAQSTQTQSRDIKKGSYYVYDIKDDTNFLIGPQSKIIRPFWLPESSSIVYVDNQSIIAVEYDSTNQQTLFAGNFDSRIVYPWSDGSRIITLTSAYPGAPANLYTISIR